MNPAPILLGYGLALGATLIGVITTTAELTWQEEPISGRDRIFWTARLPLGLQHGLLFVGIILALLADDNTTMVYTAVGSALVAMVLWAICLGQFTETIPEEASLLASISVRGALLLGSPLALLIFGLAFLA